MKIYKYALDVTDRQDVLMPDGEILCVQMQYGQPMLWVLVDPDAPIVKRVISTYGTGNLIPEGKRQYIGTYQMSAGTLVWHVFEERA